MKVEKERWSVEEAEMTGAVERRRENEVNYRELQRENLVMDPSKASGHANTHTHTGAVGRYLAAPQEHLEGLCCSFSPPTHIFLWIVYDL